MLPFNAMWSDGGHHRVVEQEGDDTRRDHWVNGRAERAQDSFLSVLLQMRQSCFVLIITHDYFLFSNARNKKQNWEDLLRTPFPHFVLFAVDIPCVWFVFIYNYLQRGRQ